MLQPHARKLRISHDVVFDELASWYALPPIVVDDGKPAENVDRNPTAETITISGPHVCMSNPLMPNIYVIYHP